ncbi:methyltransferase domain-containing protein [Terrimonas sp. NA20]|uniref:Methyltransferase domain-containing protein n=1 Tax=Terrimonas ginsenosidimutans TaxID=2908004 RepID=A0ABS9KVA3_9BACT|nr:class I SAM-dependent methyltransferase [Terrimonas ginsenosidimutans]MCG2616289.1 methyltransferase domain-containing protein [Terrimonas ginsenosidimutans]
MISHLSFKDHLHEYESWFDRHAYVFESELAALRKVWPQEPGLMSLEIGAATGRFSKELKITEALDPDSSLLLIAESRGVHIMPGMAEELPYASNQFDVVFIGTSIHYFANPPKALKEAYRVLRNSGKLITAFIDKDSEIGKSYESRKDHSTFYATARFFAIDELENEIVNAGFVSLELSQTLFGSLDNIQQLQDSKSGYGEGSYIIIKAEKPGYDYPWHSQ